MQLLPRRSGPRQMLSFPVVKRYQFSRDVPRLIDPTAPILALGDVIGNQLLDFIRQFGVAGPVPDGEYGAALVAPVCVGGMHQTRVADDDIARLDGDIDLTLGMLEGGMIQVGSACNAVVTARAYIVAARGVSGGSRERRADTRCRGSCLRGNTSGNTAAAGRCS